MECVFGLAAMILRFGKRGDDLEKFYNGSRPAMSEQQWTSLFVAGPDVQEVDI